MMKCDICGAEINMDVSKGQMPNAIEFQQESGKKIKVCTKCLVKMWAKNKEFQSTHSMRSATLECRGR